jgi:hypothetical protein
MTLDAILHWIQNTSLASTISESSWLFPTIESIHVLAITLMVGTISIIDLRLINVAWRDSALTELLAEILPLTRGGFFIAGISGGLLFSSHATKYFNNTPFRLKMLLVLLAGLNMLIFHLFGLRSVRDWNMGPGVPRGAMTAGALSLLFWVSVVSCGRWIGFV